MRYERDMRDALTGNMKTAKLTNAASPRANNYPKGILRREVPMRYAGHLAPCATCPVA